VKSSCKKGASMPLMGLAVYFQRIRFAVSSIFTVTALLLLSVTPFTLKGIASENTLPKKQGAPEYVKFTQARPLQQTGPLKPSQNHISRGNLPDLNNEVDWGPYISELQERITRNWSPPVEDRNKHVTTYFVIDREGRLLSSEIKRSSGSVAADKAALSALKASAPFRKLPVQFPGASIPVTYVF
jgi:TonB family protein